MILILLGVFLLIAFISKSVINPKNKTQVWLSSVLIPLVAFVIFALIYGDGHFGYLAGVAMAQCFLPALTSGFFIYFQLKKKLVKRKESDNSETNKAATEEKREMNTNNDIVAVVPKLAITAKKSNKSQKPMWYKSTKMKFKLKKIKLDHSEVIVSSILIGVIFALIMGFTFGDYYEDCTHYTAYRKERINGKTTPYAAKDCREVFEFNYLLAIGSLIVVSGITYLCLKKITSHQNDSDNLEKRYDNESEI